MKEPERGEQMVRFGIFELDLRSGELRKGGLRIKLQDQPFKILVALLENPGQLVTREELRSRIWPQESFGDFDHAVHIAIGKLRTALGDSAEAPRFIETLHRRGYRFIFPVATGSASEREASRLRVSPVSVPAVGETLSDGTAGVATTSNSLRAATPRGHQWRWIAAAFIVLLASIGELFWSSRPSPAPKVIRTAQITHDGFDKTNSLSDGSRVYITESTGSRQFLVQVSVAGGETSVIPTPFASIAISDISPDHSQMLVADATGTENESQLWVLPLPTGTPRRLGDITAHWNLWAAGWAVWSPDGQHIAFSKGSEIDIANADGGGVRKLVSISGTAEQMRFSPDGSHLRFSVKTPYNESLSIWEVRADGGGLHRLFPEMPNGVSDLAGDWTSDGRLYFFTRCASPSGCSVWVRPEPRGFLRRWPLPPVQLTVGPTPVFFAATSRDGKSIFAGEWTSRGELVRYDAKSRELLPFLAGLNAEQPDFSRDGQWVAFVSDADGTLWRCRLDGSERMQLSAPGISASQPRWSPDGKEIAYVNEHAGAFSQIYLVPAAGGASRQVFPEDQNQLDPTWSPDGTHLAFGRAPWLKAPAEKINIPILDLASRKISSIPESENLFSPRWSPDGKYLAAVSNDTKKLFLFDFKSKKWTKWIDEPGAVAYPIWSVDGRYLFFDNISSENPGYRRARVGQNHSDIVVSLPDLHRGIASHVGPWSGIAPDNSPLFERDLSTGEIYALELDFP